MRAGLVAAVVLVALMLACSRTTPEPKPDVGSLVQVGIPTNTPTPTPTITPIPTPTSTPRPTPTNTPAPTPTNTPTPIPTSTPTPTPTSTPTPIPTSTPTPTPTSTPTPSPEPTATFVPTPTSYSSDCELVVQSAVWDIEGFVYSNRDVGGSLGRSTWRPTFSVDWERGDVFGGRENMLLLDATMQVVVHRPGWTWFEVGGDDGFALYLDDEVVLRDWRDGSARRWGRYLWMQPGIYELRLTYYEWTDRAELLFDASPGILIPFHLVGAIKCAGRIRTLSSIHPHPTSERTRAGSDSSCSRYEFTASTLSSIHRYSLPSTHRRTSSNTRSAGLSSGL